MPEFSVNIVEHVWLAVNFATLILTISAYMDARADRRAVKLLNGKARELAVEAIVRRELLRIVVQSMLLFVALPSLFSDREVTFSPVVLMLMAVPVVLLVNSAMDARDRKRLTTMLAAELANSHEAGIARLEHAVAENTAITRDAADKAKEATVGVEASAHTLDTTHELVEDIHRKTVE